MFGRELIFLQAEIIIYGVKKTASGTELIFSRSNHTASLPDLICFELKKVIF